MKKHKLPIIIASAVIGIATALFMVAKKSSSASPENEINALKNPISQEIVSESKTNQPGEEVTFQIGKKANIPKSISFSGPKKVSRFKIKKGKFPLKNVEKMRHINASAKLPKKSVERIHHVNTSIMNRYFKTSKSLDKDISKYVGLVTESGPFQNIFIDEYYAVGITKKGSVHSAFLDVNNAKNLCKKISDELIQNREIFVRIFKKIYNSQKLSNENMMSVKRFVELNRLYDEINAIQGYQNPDPNEGILITEYEDEENLKNYITKYKTSL